MRRLRGFLALVLFTLGSLALVPGSADAGVYWTATSCNHTSPKWICFDVSAGTVTIQTSPSSQTGALATYVGSAPTRGWIAFDVFECNAAAGNVTTFTGPGANPYNLPPSFTVTADTAGPPFPGKIVVSTTARNLIASYANSQSGYSCQVVP